jgi:hypothetical protein
LKTNTPCQWYGISCADGHIWQIGIYRNELIGAIPPEIGNLGNLSQLLLADNQLTSLPPEIGNLSNLRSLDLYGGPQCQDQKSTKIRTNAPCVAKCAVSDNKVRGLAVGVVENGGNCGSLQLSPFSTTLWAY